MKGRRPTVFQEGPCIEDRYKVRQTPVWPCPLAAFFRHRSGEGLNLHTAKPDQPTDANPNNNFDDIFSDVASRPLIPPHIF